MTAPDLDSPLLRRIVRPADYVRVLATPMRLRSPHFAIHYLEGRPLPLKRPIRASEHAQQAELVHGVEQAIDAPVTARLSTELSTGQGPTSVHVVDDLLVTTSGLQRWLGLVVPKRHARRAVTRTLVKRQIRNVVADCASQLAPGLWVVRQRSPFDPKQFPSAASDALKETARAELRALFERAVRGERDKVKPRSAPATKPNAKAATVPPESPPCPA